ncbi:MAG: hypothetical protein JO139_16720 [Alphaproteobacteria bacterium]|nr:hypothetical protein [Alphaproteobacteria bacterium]
MSFLYLASVISFEICGTTSLKLFARVYPALPGRAGAVVICFSASFALLAPGTARDRSVHSDLWSGVDTAIVAATGIVCFGENTGAWKLLSLG